MPKPFRFIISLQLRHPSLPMADLVAGIGMTAKGGWTLGDERLTPKGTPLGGFRKDSYAYFAISDSYDGALAEHLGLALDRLAPHAAFLQALRQDGGSASFFVSWHLPKILFGSQDTGETFDAELMRRMGELGVDFGLNVY